MDDWVLLGTLLQNGYCLLFLDAVFFFGGGGRWGITHIIHVFVFDSRQQRQQIAYFEKSENIDLRT
jgi:hypothetical protein